MGESARTIFVLGAGAIGFPLAAHLVRAGRPVVAVRTSQRDLPRRTVTVTVHDGVESISTPVETISLPNLTRLDGLIVIASKSHANIAIAQDLRNKTAANPVVVMQNGIGVERPFLGTHLSPIYRCVLYVTSQAFSEYDFSFRPITSSPIGVVAGDSGSDLEKCIEELTTDAFPFRPEPDIHREIWKKAIVNSVFNSICPLLDVDNGVFARCKDAANLARELVRECLALTDNLGIRLGENELMEQILRISEGSDGQLISTLQDIRAGRQTEIEFLNLEIARTAESAQPKVDLPRVELLGKMILAKSLQRASR